MNKYIGKYRVFSPVDKNGKVTSNENDTYLKCKYNTEIYRYNDNTLAIYFIFKETVNNILPQLEYMGIKLTKFIDGTYESVYHFSESELNKVVDILKPQTKGAKIKPTSKRTVRKIVKKRVKNDFNV